MQDSKEHNTEHIRWYNDWLKEERISTSIKLPLQWPKKLRWRHFRRRDQDTPARLLVDFRAKIVPAAEIRITLSLSELSSDCHHCLEIADLLELGIAQLSLEFRRIKRPFSSFLSFFPSFLPLFLRTWFPPRTKEFFYPHAQKRVCPMLLRRKEVSWQLLTGPHSLNQSVSWTLGLRLWE